MRRVIYRRLSQGIPVLFLVSFFTFSLLNILPGTVTQNMLGLNWTPQASAALEKQLGLDGPFFNRYFRWMGGVLQGHFGTSYLTGQPVSEIIRQRFPVTLEIVIVSTLLALLVSIPVSLYCAYRPRGLFDMLNRAGAMAGISIPNFVVALFFVWLFAVKVHLFPATGFVPLSQSLSGNIRSVVLPSVTISLGIFFSYTRVLRADLIDQFNAAEYIAVAVAKGLGRWRVLLQHAFRNSVFPLMTLVGLHMGTVVAGTVIVESFFAIPGMGLELYQAIQNKDLPVIEAFTLLAATCVVIANLLTDMAYQLLDPRVRYERPQ